VAELTLLSPGDIFFLYTDGVYDGSDKKNVSAAGRVMRERYRQRQRESGNALLNMR